MSPKDFEEVGTIELQMAAPYMEQCATMQEAVEMLRAAPHGEAGKEEQG